MNKRSGPRRRYLLGPLLLAALCLSIVPTEDARSEMSASSGAWRQILGERLPLYGHRNWIVVADSAYPAQSSPGIETIDTGADQLEVVKAVVAALGETRHVKPNIYTDAEMKFVPEADAPGVAAYRDSLAALLQGQPVQVLPHEQIISKLDESGKTFRVLILKTKLTVPYTSVFFQLDCAYWDADKEKRLRAAMDPSKSR